VTKISQRHAAARRIAEPYPNPLDLTRPEPCAPETAASLRTAYDAAWDAANAAWDEFTGDEAVPPDEQALIAELETFLAQDEETAVDAGSTAIALVEAAPLDRPRSAVPALAPEPTPVDDTDDAFSSLRHVPEPTRTSLAMVLDAAPRRAPRHVHRMPSREPRSAPVAAVARPRRKRRPVLGTVAVAVVLLGSVAAAVLFLDGNGTPAAENAAAGSGIPWIRAQTGMPNSLLARPAAAQEPGANAAAPVAGDGAFADADPLVEKADERVPPTEAVPPFTTDVRAVATQPVTEGTGQAVAPTERGAAATTGVTATTWVNMRAGAGANEAVVAVVEPGAQVEVIACENWCEVVVNGQRGFIYNEYLAGLR